MDPDCTEIMPEAIFVERALRGRECASFGRRGLHLPRQFRGDLRRRASHGPRLYARRSATDCRRF
jgi:hypothetical protein